MRLPRKVVQSIDGKIFVTTGEGDVVEYISDVPDELLALLFIYLYSVSLTTYRTRYIKSYLNQTVSLFGQWDQISLYITQLSAKSPIVDDIVFGKFLI